jgi:hypothetical protein
MNVEEQSVALVILYRLVFNRAYELVPEFFHRHSSAALVSEVWKLRDVSASRMTLPWEFIGTIDHSQSILNLFRSNAGFSYGADALFCSLFQPNPLDGLAWVEVALRAIRGAALANYRFTTTEEIPVNYLISFDDLFCLLLGILIASGLPNPAYIAWLSGKYILKSSLSPAFEYAQANLEAVVEHCDRIDINTLLTENPPT